MSNPEKIMQRCLECMTATQIEIYKPVDLEEKDSLDDHYSDLNNPFVNTSYSLPFAEDMPTEASRGDSIVTYKVNTTHSKLQQIVCNQKLPQIDVLEEHVGSVEIAWPRNIGYNFIEEATLRIDNERIMSINSVWMDQHFQQNVDTVQDIKHASCVGNFSFTTEFSNKLPSVPTSVVLPFFKRVEDSFPLFFLGNVSTMSCELRLRNTIGRLLRMRVWNCPEHGVSQIINCRFGTCKDRVTYEDKPADPTLLRVGGITNVNGQDPTIPLPSLTGYYNRLTPEEIDTIKKDDCNTYNVYYYEDVLTEKTYNSSRFRQTVDLPIGIKSTNFPVLGFYWVAQSVQAEQSNNFSNYTTNLSDSMCGFSPISRTLLFMNGNVKLFELPSIQTEKIIPMIKGFKGHVESGYNVWLVHPTANTNLIKSSYPPSDFRLVVNLDDTNPNSLPKANNSLEFKLICHILVQRKIEFTRDQRQDQRCKFILDGESIGV